MRFPWQGRKEQQASNNTQPKPRAPLKGTELVAEKADALLAQHKELIENLWAFSQLDRDRYNLLYVELFRNIPLIVQLFFWAFVFPQLLPLSMSTGSGEMVAGGWWQNILNDNPAIIGVFALGLYTAARIAEQVRAGISTVSQGQKNAAFAIGLTQNQSYRYVILPVAYRIVWPTLTSEAMNVFKNSAVLFALSVLNFFAYTKTMREETSQDIVILILSTPVYLVITYAIKYLMGWIEKRMAVPGLGSGGK